MQTSCFEFGMHVELVHRDAVGLGGRTLSVAMLRTLAALVPPRLVSGGEDFIIGTVKPYRIAIVKVLCWRSVSLGSRSRIGVGHILCALSTATGGQFDFRCY